MIHRDDYEALEKLFRGKEIPADVVTEYDIWHRMASAYGNSGPLGMYLIIPLLRQLGYGKVVESPAAPVDWRKHIGEDVVASYGDQMVPGQVVELTTNGKLGVDTALYGHLELPRHCVKLAPTQELQVAKQAWGQVKAGAKVTVKTEAGDVVGKFVESTPDGLRVKVRGGEAVYPLESVELTA